MRHRSPRPLYIAKGENYCLSTNLILPFRVGCIRLRWTSSAVLLSQQFATNTKRFPTGGWMDRCPRGSNISAYMDPTREPQVARKSAAAKRRAGRVLSSLTRFIKHRLKLQSKRSCSPHRIRPLSLMGRTNPTDNLSMLRPESLAHSLHVRRIVGVIEGDGVYRGRNPRGEPQ